MDTQGKAYGYALLSVLMWSTAASAFKLSLDHLDFIELLFYSSLSSWVVLLLILTAQGKLCQIRAYSRADMVNSAKLGFLNPFLYYVVLFKAYSLLPAQEAQPLNFTWPLMLAVLSIPLLKQKITFMSILALLISFSGVFLISTHGDILGFQFTDPLGAGLAMGSGIVWALFWIYNIRDERDEVCKLFLNFLFGFLFITIPFLYYTDLTPPPLSGSLGGIYVGLFEMGLTFVVWMRALKFSEQTSHVANLIYATPFASLVFIHFVVGEEILDSTVIGLFLIVTGILIQQSASRFSKDDGEGSGSTTL
jgi:drug/metabolite transporter (DMT)-like permease